jgi:L-fucose isomerase-like protein
MIKKGLHPMTVAVRIGFVPSYRFQWTDWTARMRADSLAALSALKGVEAVLFPTPSADGATLDAEKGWTPHGAVHDLDEAEVVAAYFRQQRVDGLVLCPLDFGDERSAAKIAEQLGVPVLLYATREPAGLPGPALARQSDSYCGNLSIASALYRRKIPFHFAGVFFPDEPEFAAALDPFIRAVAVVKGLRGARLGQVGVRPATFETVGYDEHALALKFGQNVIYANLDDIVDLARRYSDDDPQIGRVMAEVRGEFAQITVSDHYLRNAARLELALTEFWRRSKLSAMAVQCWPAIQRMMNISVCNVYSRLTDRGLLTACEADVLGALAMLISHRVALGETAPHFVDWTIQHRENPDWLLAWHCGNAPVSLAADRSQTALRSRKDMAGALPAPEVDPQAGLNQFQVRPGAVTLCRLAEYDNQWKLLITTGEIMPSNETLAGAWSWVAVEDHARLYRTLVEEGFIHHASMIHGDWTAALLQACRFLDIRPVVV